MSQFLSDYLLQFQNLLAPGFLYLIGIMILIQAHLKYQILHLLSQHPKFLLYVGIAVVAFSFILGLSFFLTEQGLKFIVRSIIEQFEKFRGDVDINKNLKYEENYEKSVSLYAVLIMYRHLIISVNFVVIALSYYYRRKNKRIEHIWFFTIAFFSLIILLFLAYIQMKFMVDSLYMDGHVPWSLVVICNMFLVAITLCFMLRTNRKRKPVQFSQEENL